MELSFIGDYLRKKMWNIISPGIREAEAFIHQLSYFPLVEGCLLSILVCICLWPRQLLRCRRKFSEGGGLQYSENCLDSSFTSPKQFLPQSSLVQEMTSQYIQWQKPKLGVIHIRSHLLSSYTVPNRDPGAGCRQVLHALFQK